MGNSKAIPQDKDEGEEGKIFFFVVVLFFFLKIHSPIEGHLGCFQLGWLYYTAPLNSHVQVFVGT